MFRKAQITLFIILGITILLISGLAIYIYNQTTLRKAETEAQRLLQKRAEVPQSQIIEGPPECNENNDCFSSEVCHDGKCVKLICQGCQVPYKHQCEPVVCCSHADCDDQNPSTSDECHRPYSLLAQCVHSKLWCGDGICSIGESPATCPSDCKREVVPAEVTPPPSIKPETVPPQRTNCLKSGVCVNDKILLVIQEEGGPFITYGTRNVPTQPGEIAVDDEVIRFYSQQVTREADFLIVFKDWDAAPSATYYWPIKRSFGGIRTPTFDRSSDLGLKGQLQAAVFMPNIARLKDPTYFEIQIATLAHEIGHHWLVYLRDPTLKLAYDYAPHYVDCLGLGTRDLMLEQTTNWTQISEHEFIAPLSTQSRRDAEFTQLSLYLMGLVPKEAVPPMYIIKPNEGDSCTQNIKDNFYHVTGTRQDITINDIIDVYGERIPSHTDSQKNFTLHFALVAHAGSELTQDDVNRFQEFIEAFEKEVSTTFSNKASIEISSVI